MVEKESPANFLDPTQDKRRYFKGGRKKSGLTGARLPVEGGRDVAGLCARGASVPLTSLP